MTFKTAHTFTLIVPDFTNDGTPTTAAREHVDRTLLALFGGFSHVYGFGAWSNPDGRRFDDCNVTYSASVVTDLDPQQYRNAMIELAGDVKRMAQQEAVMLSYRAEQIAFI